MEPKNISGDKQVELKYLFFPLQKGMTNIKAILSKALQFWQIILSLVTVDLGLWLKFKSLFELNIDAI